jgi:hypothetical protein
MKPEVKQLRKLALQERNNICRLHVRWREGGLASDIEAHLRALQTMPMLKLIQSVKTELDFREAAGWPPSVYGPFDLVEFIRRTDPLLKRLWKSILIAFQFPSPLRRL